MTKQPPCHSLLTVHSFGLTDRGKVRDTNEDNFLIAALFKALQIKSTSLPQPRFQHSSDRSYLFVVADGMGGRAGGEKASAFAIDSVESFVLESLKWFAQCQGADQDQLLADFQSALREASDRIRAEAAESPELHGMGTTLTLAYRLNNMLFVAHAGDSRCYLCRNTSLHRLTRDHSLVAELVDRGALTANEAIRHPLRHVVTNALGGANHNVRVEIQKFLLQAEDTILLCSDGLTGMVSDETISQILQTETDPERSCRALVAAANDAGGKDNITVVVARFDETTGERVQNARS